MNKKKRNEEKQNKENRICIQKKHQYIYSRKNALIFFLLLLQIVIRLGSSPDTKNFHLYHREKNILTTVLRIAKKNNNFFPTFT